MEGTRPRTPSKPSDIRGEGQDYLCMWLSCCDNSSITISRKHLIIVNVRLPFIPDNICLTLSDAISRGDASFASNLAQQLAAQKAAVKIRLDDPENEELARGGKDNKIKFVYHHPCKMHLPNANKNVMI